MTSFCKETRTMRAKHSIYQRQNRVNREEKQSLNDVSMKWKIFKIGKFFWVARLKWLSS